MSEGLVILGTDTGVGKTYVACGLARGLRERGLRPGALKPVESGYEDATCDARLLAEACGEIFDPAVHVPQRYLHPLAPLAAAREEGRPFDTGAAVEHARQRASGCGVLLVETAGGIRVPLTEDVSNLELVAMLGWPALLVARAGLGTINHSLLTLEAARSAGIDVLGFVLNGQRDSSTSLGGGNRRLIEEMSSNRCIGEVGHGADPAAELDWEHILAALGHEEKTT